MLGIISGGTDIAEVHFLFPMLSVTESISVTIHTLH